MFYPDAEQDGSQSLNPSIDVVFAAQQLGQSIRYPIEESGNTAEVRAENSELRTTAQVSILCESESGLVGINRQVAEQLTNLPSQRVSGSSRGNQCAAMAENSVGQENLDVQHTQLQMEYGDQEKWKQCFDSFIKRGIDENKARSFANKMLYHSGVAHKVRCFLCSHQSDPDDKFQHRQDCSVVRGRANDNVPVATRSREETEQGATGFTPGNFQQPSHATQNCGNHQVHTSLQQYQTPARFNNTAEQGASGFTPGNFQQPSHATQNCGNHQVHTGLQQYQTPARFNNTEEGATGFTPGNFQQPSHARQNCGNHQGYRGLQRYQKTTARSYNTESGTVKSRLREFGYSEEKIRAVEQTYGEITSEEWFLEHETLVDIASSNKSSEYVTAPEFTTSSNCNSQREQGRAKDHSSDLPVELNPDICGLCHKNRIAVTQLNCRHIVCRDCLPAPDQTDGKFYCYICREEVISTVAFDANCTRRKRRL